MRLIAFLICLFPIVTMASKARLQSLGLNENGSLLIKDQRGIFLNPAQINGEQNSINIEMGSSTVPSTPNAEGGFFYVLEDSKIGIQLGRETNMATDVTTMNNLAAAYDFLIPQNTIEVIYGTRAKDLDWGVSLIYASSEDNAVAGAFPNKKASNLTLRGGYVGKESQGYLYLDLLRDSENQTAATTTGKFDGGIGVGAGGNYLMSKNSIVYGQLDIDTTKANDGAGTTSTEISATTIQGGYRRIIPIEKGKGFFFFAAGLLFQSGSIDDKIAATSTNNDLMSLPVVIGLEIAVKDWLDLRGSVSQNVLIQKIDDGDDDRNFPNSTTVNGGVSLKVSKSAQVDATLAGATTGNINSATLLANASLLYWF